VTAASPRRSPACLNHARLRARLDSEGRIVTPDRQDRRLWDTCEIAKSVRVLQSAPAVQRPAAVLGRAVVVGHVLGAAAGLRETDRLRSAWFSAPAPRRSNSVIGRALP